MRLYLPNRLISVLKPVHHYPSTDYPHEIKRSLTACRKEGAAAAVMTEVFDYYLIPFCLFLGGTNVEIGLLMAIPAFLSAISQFFAVDAVEHAGSRLQLLLWGVGAHMGLLLVLAFLPFLSISGRVTLLIVLICVFRAVGTVIGPAWGSLVSDYLPEHHRGRYFGSRQRAISIASIAGLVIWGSLLYEFKKISGPAAFSCLFAGALAFRAVSYYYMTQMADLPLHDHPDHHFSFWMFLKRFKESNFVKFIFYIASITFATQMASPYFTVFMLRDLHFNYLQYTAIQLSTIIAGLLAFPVWGHHADMVGNAKILKITSFLIPLVPFLWMLSTNPFYLMAVELFSGFIWGGFNLCATNFIYDAVCPEKRVRCLGYFNLINGLAVFAGASLGGYLSGVLPKIWGYSLYTLFFLSGILRLLADFFLSRHFQEVRASAAKVSSSRLFFSVLGIRPISGENIEFEFYPSRKQV